jgi:hypothetical protein
MYLYTYSQFRPLYEEHSSLPELEPDPLAPSVAEPELNQLTHSEDPVDTAVKDILSKTADSVFWSDSEEENVITGFELFFFCLESSERRWELIV